MLVMRMDGPGSILRYKKNICKAKFPCAMNCRNADMQMLSKIPLKSFGQLTKIRIVDRLICGCGATFM
jgi:hypothetical protein